MNGKYARVQVFSLSLHAKPIDFVMKMRLNNEPYFVLECRLHDYIRD